MNADVVIIGAGPSGAVAAALLRKRGYSVLVLEKQRFPRFSIGESLLPQSMVYLEEAGMLPAIEQARESAGFQFKDGAIFAWDGRYCEFDFTQKFSPGPGTTYQVRRAEFDHLLAKQAEAVGAEIRFEHEIVAVDCGTEQSILQCRDPDGNNYELTTRFVLDASGFARVLPRLLKLETPSGFPVRRAVFTHVDDHIDRHDKATQQALHFNRDRIRIVTHPTRRDVWYWLIPFSDGRLSVGCVAADDYFDQWPDDALTRIRGAIAADPTTAKLLAHAEYNHPANQIVGYAANVTTLHGPGFALLGNAGEFLDPIFSSGVTIAVRSASMAVDALDRQFRGDVVDWDAEFEQPLRLGVETFRTFVAGWYDASFQDAIYAQNQQENIRQMISSILAGYAWDTDNPFVAKPERRLRALVETIRRNGDAPLQSSNNA